MLDRGALRGRGPVILEDVDLAALLDVAGGARCAAAEISITADQGDIARAVKRAATLGVVAGERGLRW